MNSNQFRYSQQATYYGNGPFLLCTPNSDKQESILHVHAPLLFQLRIYVSYYKYMHFTQ